MSARNANRRVGRSDLFASYGFIYSRPVEERDGAFYVAGVRLHPDDLGVAFSASLTAYREKSLRRSGVPIPERVYWALDDAIAAEAQAAGRNMPVSLVSNMRLNTLRSLQRAVSGQAPRAHVLRRLPGRWRA
jgi:hypothetical protein